MRIAEVKTAIIKIQSIGNDTNTVESGCEGRACCGGRKLSLNNDLKSSVSFVPKQGEKYHVEIVRPENISAKYELPTALDQGFTMGLIVGDKEIEFRATDGGVIVRIAVCVEPA